MKRTERLREREENCIIEEGAKAARYRKVIWNRGNLDMQQRPKHSSSIRYRPFPSRVPIFCLIFPMLCLAYMSVAETSDRDPSFLSAEVDLMRWFLIAFLTNGAFIVTHAGFEPTNPAL